VVSTNRIAGALLFGYSLVATVLAVAFERISRLLPAVPFTQWVSEPPQIDFPRWAWAIIGLGLITGALLLVDPFTIRSGRNKEVSLATRNTK